MNTTSINTREEILECNIKALTELIKDLMEEQGLLRAQVDTLYKEVESLRSQINSNVK